MALSTGAMLVFTQLDKIVLSRLLPLSEFGLYSIAWTAAGIFYLFYSPVAAIGLPRFTRFAATGDRSGLLRSYSLASQIVGVGVIPTATILSIYSCPILTIWLHDKAMATTTAPLLQLLAPFAAAGALAYIPAVFQWAQGWTAPTSVTNLAASVALGPSLYLAYRSGGTRVAILAWGILRLGQATWQVAWAHRRLIPDQSIQWFWKSVGLPAVIGAGVCLAAQRLLPAEPGIAGIVGIWLAAVVACSLAATELRDRIAPAFGRLHLRPSVPSEPRFALLAGRADAGGRE
jgi:O-antigen/teichoic acid export membrane protein